MMDAVKFIKAMQQMLRAGADDSTVQKYISAYKKNDCEGMVEAAEQWAKEHPIKTRQSEFLKLFPGAAPTKDGVLAICPNAFSPVYKDEWGLCKRHYVECDNCCREFWLAEVEE